MEQEAPQGRLEDEASQPGPDQRQPFREPAVDERPETEDQSQQSPIEEARQLLRELPRHHQPDDPGNRRRVTVMPKFDGLKTWRVPLPKGARKSVLEAIATAVANATTQRRSLK